MKYALLVILTIISISCQKQIPFNAEKWNEKSVDWQLADDRERMVSDLIESDTLLGLNAAQVIQLLGEPELAKAFTYDFLIREKYSFNIDPDYIKYLVVEFNKNGKVKKYYIKEI